jgi:hypothetical protein
MYYDTYGVRSVQKIDLVMEELIQEFGDIRKQRKRKENECRIW